MLPLRLKECGQFNVREVEVLNGSWQEELDWDRYIRLQFTANRILSLDPPKDTIILDVGGGDGALALFLPKYRVWVIDPATTGSSGIGLPFHDSQFSLVVSVDAVEHVPRSERARFVHELIRICSGTLLLHFPESSSMEAQRIAHMIVPSHQFVREHVEFELPSCKEIQEMIQTGLSTRPHKITIHSHTSIVVWLLWFILHNAQNVSGNQISNYLKTHSSDTEAISHLYYMLECSLID